MFILNCIVSVVMLIRLIVIIYTTRPGLLVGSAAFFITLLAVAIPVINGAFFYALCDRALPDTLSGTPIKTNERNIVFGVLQ
jgi:hypothetical protein